MNKKLLTALLLSLLLVSCSKDPDDTYPEDTQNKALKAWMSLNREELLENLQEEGDYYVDVISAGDMSADPIRSYEDVWVEYRIECRTLQGDLILTRDSMQAKQQGTFTKYTHYVPFFQFAGKPFFEDYLEEGIHLSLRNTLTLGATYAADKGLPRELDLRVGSEVVLYMPAGIVSASNSNGSGGYQGQYTLDPDHPMIARIEVMGQSRNPIGRESEAVDAFAAANGGFEPEPGAAGTHSWKIASKSAAQVYYNTTYDPTSDATGLFSYLDPYVGSQEKADELDRRINEALVERFGEATPGVLLRADDNVHIWYVARFLDGFVLDTNIEEVKQIIYGPGGARAGSAISYTPSLNKDAELGAWYYALPEHFRYGTYGAIVTPSSNAYGGGGKSPSGASGSQTDYYGAVNNLLHPDLTGNYYDAFYNMVFMDNGVPSDYYYDSMVYLGSSADSVTSWNGSSNTTTTTATTEVLPYTPVLIQFYIVPEE